jgi:hypothetical protein
MNLSTLMRSLCMLATFSAVSVAGQTLVQSGDPLGTVNAVDDAVLDQLRGGYSWGEGLRVSFGLVRTVAINGEQVHRSSFHVSDVTGMVQSGANNVVAALDNSPMTGFVVQNSLNNQQISTLTEVNTAVNSMGLMKSLNASQVMQEALLGGLRVR